MRCPQELLANFSPSLLTGVYSALHVDIHLCLATTKEASHVLRRGSDAQSDQPRQGLGYQKHVVCIQRHAKSGGRQHTPKREVACILGVAASAAARASSASALLTVTSCTMYVSHLAVFCQHCITTQDGPLHAVINFRGGSNVASHHSLLVQLPMGA